MQSNNIEAANALAKLKGIIHSTPKAKRHQHLYEIYEPIVVQYATICGANGFNQTSDEPIGWMNFWDKLKQSINLVYDNLYLLNATESLNTLAKEWDSIVQKNDSPKRSHVFFFCCTKDDVPPDKNNAIYTRMFYDIAPPDQRLICIFIPSPTKFSPSSFYEVLHEVGHYIGRRLRTERISMYRDAVAAEFCNQIYLRLIQIALGEANTLNISANIEDNLHLPAWIRTLSCDIRTYTLNTYKSLLVAIRENYSNAKRVMQSDISKESYCSEQQRSAAIKAVDYGYFSYLTPIVLHALEACRSCIEDGDTSSLQIAHQSKEFIKDNICTVLDSLWDEIKISDQFPAWINTCESHFKEPGADLFMIRLATMRSHEYINTMLLSAFNCWNSSQTSIEEKTTFLEFLINYELFPKVVGVIETVFEGDKQQIIDGKLLYRLRCIKCFSPWSSKRKREALESGFDFLRQALLAYDTTHTHILNEDDKNLLTIFNPIHRVCRYMTDVKNRFWHHIDNNGLEIFISRKEQLCLKKIISPYKYSMPLFPVIRFFSKKATTKKKINCGSNKSGD